MGEPAAAAAATSERDVLLATKLNVPGVRPDLVPRPRLAQRLDEGQRQGLVLACAPAGYGKTVLLADWVRRGRHPVAWLSLDAGDNDPARFWRHAVAALDRVRPGISERIGPLLGPPAPSSFEPVVTALINEVAGQPAANEALLLVLDDYHVISSPLVHASLGFLLEHRPPGLHLALTSRSDPPLALARLRARGQLTELRAADLRFTPGEATALLQQVAAAPGGVRLDAPLPDAVAAALAARTEGWAAGLQLAALSLRGQQDAAGFVAAFSGSHRYVLDYLAGEVLDRQPDQVREFLLETSMLERLSGDLCDAVTGRTGSQAMLEAIEAAGLFLTPLDEVRGWWRYHRLFADLLQARLRQEQPGRLPGLHRAAAAWCDAHGLADETIRHALAAGDAAGTARLIERHYDAIFLRGESATIQRWISALPAGLARSRPRLLLAQTWMALVGGEVEAARAPLDAAECAFADAADEPFEPSVGRAASLLANVPAAIGLGRAYLAVLHGDAEGTASSASRALAALGEGEWVLHSASLWILAIAEWVRGRLEDAERGFAASVAGWRAAGQRSLAAWACLDLGRVQRARGRLDATVATYQQVVEINAPPGRAAMPAAGIGYVGMAEVAYQRNEFGAAYRLVTEGIPLCRQLNWKTQPLAAGLVTLAWIRQANGDPGGALEAIAEAERIAPSPSLANLFNPVPAQRARLLLAQGDIAAAARWAQQGGLRADDEPMYQKEREHLMLARVLLAQARPVEALALLDRLHVTAAAQDRTGSLIEIGALRALALAASGDADRAVATLAEALTLASSQGHVRVFADEGAPMAALLARLITAQRSGGAAAQVPLGCLARLQRALGAQDIIPDAGRGSVAAVPGLVEQLTSRELEVLQMLAAGKSNQAIASRLVVTLDTVKKHVSHVLGKLGATNRTEAVARARELSLIP
jgi:LuxR family transcriptional regulator, maltose regulon positive regulatory protein